MMGSFGLLGAGLFVLLSILLCVHAVRTGREMYWLFIILLFMPIGGLVYAVAILLPELARGPAIRKAGQAARESLDPTRAYREARAAVEETPTVHNQMRLAAAASALGKWAEAEALYAEAAQGVHAEDPALMLGRANALLELGRPGEALALLEKLSAVGDKGRTPQMTLAFARAYDGLGRPAEADPAYEQAAARVPGLEGLARRAAFLARQGRKTEAQEILADIDRRLEKSPPHFRREGRVWRDLAAEAMAAR
jgi:hypothetical protein